jgi:pimeloyl-ACP methyl ester carboxylesterase
VQAARSEANLGTPVRTRCPAYADSVAPIVETGLAKLIRIEGSEGPPVLLIPGWPQTWYARRHIMPALATPGFRAIAVDPRGLIRADRNKATILATWRPICTRSCDS